MTYSGRPNVENNILQELDLKGMPARGHLLLGSGSSENGWPRPMEAVDRCHLREGLHKTCSHASHLDPQLSALLPLSSTQLPRIGMRMLHPLSIRNHISAGNNVRQSAVCLTKLVFSRTNMICSVKLAGRLSCRA